MNLLAQHPDQRAIWQNDVDGVTATAVEEIVRYASPVTFMRRTLTTDLTMSGHDFVEGDKVVMLAQAAADGGQLDVWSKGGTNVVRLASNPDGGDVAVWSAAGKSVGGLFATPLGGREAVWLGAGRSALAIAAGGVKTEMHERITGKLDAASNDAYAARHPLGLGDPDDVVGLGLFLISDLGRWMTGATIVMDGGYCTR